MEGIVENRLFVGDLPAGCTKTDVQLLIERSHLQVHDVYTPNDVTITGVPRRFAIVQCRGDATGFRNVIKALNNCLWKGSRLRVEIAKEFLFQRLTKERLMQPDSVEKAEISCSSDIPPFTNEYVRLRKYACRPVTEISVVPRSSTSAVSKRPACKKSRLDESGGADYIIEEVTTMDNNNQCQRKVVDTSVRTSGVRRGFGTLVSCSTCIDHSPVNIVEDSLEDENIPCLSAEEVSQYSLEQERSRYKKTILLLSGGQHLGADPVRSQQAETVGSQFTNLTELKSIFHKEGGVEWENDNTLKGCVFKDAALNHPDSIFLEAEKKGIDLRQDGNKHSMSASMVFDFFAVAGDNNTTAISSTSSSNPSSFSCKSIAYASILRKAKQFKGVCTNDSTATWTASREKNYSDFKRKRREAIKSTKGNKSKSNQFSD